MENKKDFVPQILNFLSDANRLMRAVESVLIDLFSATAPWLAPVLPAYMVWHSLTNRLDMPGEISFMGAVVVELLGLSAINTTLTLWDYNDRKREAVLRPVKARKGKGKKTPRKIRGLAPVWVAGSAGLFYLVVVLVVNVLLDDAEPVELAAKALLSSLSVVAGLILAVRGQHARRLEFAEKRREAVKRARAISAEKRQAQRQMSESDEDQRQMSQQTPTMPTFDKGYDGFVEYLSYLKEGDATFDKSRAAADLGYSVRQIERYIEAGKANGAAEILAEVSKR